METDKKFNLNRARILREIKDNQPVAIHQLVEKLKPLPRSTIVYNLDQLKLRGLISYKKKKELGSPVYIEATDKAQPLLKTELKVLELLGFKK